MVAPSPVANGLIPRDRMAATAAPMSPNTAPDAPTVSWLGSMSSTPNEPATRATM